MMAQTRTPLQPTNETVMNPSTLNNCNRASQNGSLLENFVLSWKGKLNNKVRFALRLH